MCKFNFETTKCCFPWLGRAAWIQEPEMEQSKPFRVNLFLVAQSRSQAEHWIVATVLQIA